MICDIINGYQQMAFAKTKTQIICAVSASASFFSLHSTLFFLNLKFQDSSLLLWL